MAAAAQWLLFRVHKVNTYICWLAKNAATEAFVSGFTSLYGFKTIHTHKWHTTDCELAQSIFSLQKM